MSGMGLGVAVSEAVVLASKAAILTDTIKTNIGLGIAEEDQLFATLLASTIENVRDFFARKQKLGDWQLKGMHPAWQYEIQQAFSDLEVCTKDLKVVAGSPQRKAIYKGEKRREFAEPTNRAASLELKHISVKLSSINLRILALEVAELVLEEEDGHVPHLVGADVSTGVDAQVDRIVEEVRRMFESAVGGCKDALIALFVRELQDALGKHCMLSPSRAMNGTYVGSVSGSTASAFELSSVSEDGDSHGATGITYEVARNKDEATFPRLAKILHRMENRCAGLSFSEEEYESLKTVFQDLWAPWQVDSSFLDPVVDKRTGRARVLGHGTRGTVFEYRMRIASGKSIKVATKVVDRNLSTVGFRSDFFREASILYRTCHPCIAKFYGAQWPSLPTMTEGNSRGGCANGAFQTATNPEWKEENTDEESDDGCESENVVAQEARLILERMDGDLGSLTQKGDISDSNDLLRAFADAAEALAYIHEQGVLHLNFKPENILVRCFRGRMLGRAKITDFGVPWEKWDSMAKSGIRRGGSSPWSKPFDTAVFMAPELYLSADHDPGEGGPSTAESIPSKCRARSTASPAFDTYSLGLTLAAVWSQLQGGENVSQPACFTRDEEAIGEAWKTGLLSQQVAQWVRSVFQDQPALLEIAAACTKQQAEERPCMADVYRALLALAKGGPAACVELTVVRLEGRKLQGGDEMFAIARKYSSGHSGSGIAKNAAKAAGLFKLAADEGNIDAMCNLGRMYRDGRGVEKDDVKAARLYILAAERGNVCAMNTIGFMYWYGCGVSKNLFEAQKWYRRAADGGNEHAKNVLCQFGELIGDE